MREKFERDLSHGHAAIDSDDLARDVTRGRAGKECNNSGDVLGFAERGEGDFSDDGFLMSSGSSSVMSVVMKPGATALQVTPRPASSRATALVKPIRPALLAE